MIHTGFDSGKPSFGSLLGISYYLSKEEWERLVGTISSFACEGSSICFDYPLTESGSESHRNRELAAAAGEPMKAKYSYSEMEALLSEEGFLIYEHMNAAEAAEAFFREYNQKNAEHMMTAPEGVGYCLAVKKLQKRNAVRIFVQYLCYNVLAGLSSGYHSKTISNVII